MKRLPFLLCAVLFFSCKETAPSDKEKIERVPTDTVAPESTLAALGITLPTPSAPVANYVKCVRTGNLLFLAGAGPMKDGQYITGRLGADLSIEQGYQAARLTAINQLAVLKAELGDLRKVRRVVKVLGMVQCTPDFTNQPEVVNGFSDLMVEVFGERGKHARSAVGMSALPRGMAVEVELVVEVGE
ncbi:MAG: RidA family protein [Saprospiraceae bacterium]|nr:RidA family protein [Saprospiraceae bacterium]